MRRLRQCQRREQFSCCIRVRVRVRVRVKARVRSRVRVWVWVRVRVRTIRVRVRVRVKVRIQVRVRVRFQVRVRQNVVVDEPEHIENRSEEVLEKIMGPGSKNTAVAVAKMDWSRMALLRRLAPAGTGRELLGLDFAVLRLGLARANLNIGR